MCAVGYTVLSRFVYVHVRTTTKPTKTHFSESIPVVKRRVSAIRIIKSDTKLGEHKLTQSECSRQQNDPIQSEMNELHQASTLQEEVIKIFYIGLN